MVLFNFPVDQAISPSKDLLEWLAKELFEEAGQGLDLSDKAVVFPGRRPALYLRRKLGSLFGRAYLPPRIFDIDSFMAWLCSRSGREPVKEVGELELLYILHRVCVSAGKSQLGFMLQRLDHFSFWGKKLLELFEELSVELVSPERLETLIPYALNESGICGEVKGIWPLLPELYSRWILALKNERVLSRGEKYRIASKEVKTLDIPFSRIYFAGFVALNKAEEEVVCELHASGKAFVVAQPLGDSVPSSSLFEKVDLVGCADIHDQMLAASQRLKPFAQAAQIEEDDLVLVLPDPATLVPLLNWVIEDLGQPCNISMGMPLNRTPLARLLLAIFSAQQNRSEGLYYHKDYHAIMSHPYIRALGKNLGYHRQPSISASLNPYVSISQVTNRENAHLHALLFGAFEQVDHMKNFVDAIQEIIEAFEKEHVVQEYPLAQEMNTALHDLMHEVLASGFAEIQTTAREASAFMSRLVGNCRIPLPGMPLKGVQVLGFLETRCLSFQNVFVFDLNEGIVPPDTKPDPLMPPSLRHEIGLPERHRAVQISRYHFLRLIEGAQKVTLFYAEKRGKMRSRFVEELIWTHEKEARRLWNPKIMERGLVANAPQQPFQGVPKSEDVLRNLSARIFSPTSIDTYMQCPFRFYLHYVLGLEELDSVGPDPSPALVGTIVHEVLYKIYQPFRGTFIDSGPMPELETVIKEKLDKELGEDPGMEGVKAVLFQTLCYRLENFIKKDMERCIGTKLLDLELEERILFPVSSSKSIVLKGIIDRLEQDKNGKYWVIDYKTGTKLKLPDISKVNIENRTRMKETIKSFQLPIYLLLVDKALVLEGNWNEINGALIHLKGFKPTTDINKVMKTLFDSGSDHREAMNDLFIPGLKYLLHELFDPEKLFEQDISDPGYCSACPYCQNVCMLNGNYSQDAASAA